MTTNFDELLERFHATLATFDDALVRDAVAQIAWAMPARRLEPRPLACLRQLDRIVELAPANAQPLARLLAQRRGELHWGQTYSEADLGKTFIDNYGWLEVFGTRGHFVNDEVAAGLLILGPDIVDFRRREAGEVIHHASDVSHAMRTGKEPLLALYIWRGGPLTAKSTISGSQGRN
ncbi:MAG: transcriptional regulator [Mesorhizobium sp.]|nr:MAG: transcriptional regulator [Mesorhizobium sp.]